MRTRAKSGRRCGFTLVDAAAAVVSLGLIGLVLAPAMAGPSMRASWGLRSQQNLSIIGQASAVYINENDGLLPAYSWKGGVPYTVYGAGSVVSSDDASAQVRQNTDILRRLTQRVGDPATEILPNPPRLIHRRFTHLILADHWNWGPTPEFFASPEDVNLQRWRADPLDVSSVPYADGFAGLDPAQYDLDSNWTKAGAKQRWAYGSSYMFVPASWQPDAVPGYVPVAYTPHLTMSVSPSGGSIPLGGRRLSEVALPAQKVHVHEEFDWRPVFDTGSMSWRSDGAWFAYGSARVGKLMFDGSVNDLPSAMSNPGWNAVQPDRVWEQPYRAIHTFPLFRGTDSNRKLPMRFHWTRDGLGGIDYPVLGP